MRDAGAIFIGKSNVPEFALGSHSYNPLFGTTGNAFDASKSAGGSTGGGAVALALRMVPVTDGSDFGGSLRHPAGRSGEHTSELQSLMRISSAALCLTKKTSCVTLYALAAVSTRMINTPQL